MDVPQVTVSALTTFYAHCTLLCFKVLFDFHSVLTRISKKTDNIKQKQTKFDQIFI